MYIIDDTYFQAPKREIANLNEADSRSFVELEQLIDYKCRLFLLYFLTAEEVAELESYLTDGLFPEDTTDIPQKWIDLVNGATYEHQNVSFIWNGLKYSKGTFKGSIMADFVYYHWLVENVSYMTGTGDTKANPKGATSVNPTQRVVRVWNDFVEQYQKDGFGFCNPYDVYYGYFNQIQKTDVSLIQFLTDNNEVYPNSNRKYFEIKNQLGL